MYRVLFSFLDSREHKSIHLQVMYAQNGKYFHCAEVESMDLVENLCLV